MANFFKANKGKIVAVTGAVLVAVGSYLTGAADLMSAIMSVVGAIAGN